MVRDAGVGALVVALPERDPGDIQAPRRSEGAAERLSRPPSPHSLSLELSQREALLLGHNYIGTEHILLGLIREGQGVAAQMLQAEKVDLEVIRSRVTVRMGEQASALLMLRRKIRAATKGRHDLVEHVAVAALTSLPESQRLQVLARVEVAVLKSINLGRGQD